MMFRSKSSRSAFGDLGNKSHESVIARKFSAAKFCRGDNIGNSVDSNALKSLGRTSLDTNSSKSARFTESRIQKALMVQEHMGQLEQELKWAKDRIFVVEEERKREAKCKGVNESLPTKKVGELMTEIKTLKEELRTKDKDIESLRKELEEAKQFEVKLSERESLLDKMKEDMEKVKESEAFIMNQLLSSKKKIVELEDEAERRKATEAKLLDSYKSEMKQLEQEKVEVEESKRKIVSLYEKIVSFKTSIKHQENEGSEKVGVEFLKKELRLALDAEEKSKKAMDDLALVLKEVATEANQVKEKLRITESDLENSKSETEQLKQIVRNTEERYKKLLDEAKKEAELYKNTVERLRIEAEEALLKSPSMIVENHDELKKVKKPFNLHYNDDDLDRKDMQKDSAKVASPDVHHRRESFVFTDDDETTNSDELDIVEDCYNDDSDSDKKIKIGGKPCLEKLVIL